MKASVLVVVYNESIQNITCIDYVVNAPQVGQIVICDNSTVDNGNAALARDFGFDYISMRGNAGLSRAYNVGVRSCTSDVICLFDDDTLIDNGYFEELDLRLFDGSSWDVLLPLVVAGNEVLSPSQFDGYRTHAFQSGETITCNTHLTGINSGMAVKREVFDKVAYDESLFLDLIDHQFILDVRKAGYKVEFDDKMRLEQKFSLSTDDSQSALFRFGLYSRDARRFYSRSISQRIYCELMLLGRRARQFARYGDARFLFNRSREEVWRP